jgi:para-nitrobenzyl esterase
MKHLAYLLALAPLVALSAAPDRVKVQSGVLEGTTSEDASVRIFKGVPFAAPPVGDLRWKAPQPVPHWKGVRKADDWGPRCIQGLVFADIIQREKTQGEDCLYLNIWAPAKSAKNSKKKLPVFVWYHGGGFAAGSGSEPRYDGAYLAKQGIVVLDQVEALEWVKANIAAFGGDPNSVTIGGESAGSFSVSALMASPLSRGLIHKAIGESGAFAAGRSSTLAELPLAASEQVGVTFAKAIGASNLAELRAMSAEKILAQASQPNVGRFSPNIYGYFLPTPASEIYAKGQQARIPLLAGWNSSEIGMAVALNPVKPTPTTFQAQLAMVFKDKAEAAKKAYPAATNEEAEVAAAALASDQFIVYGTWKWIEEQARTKVPVYRFQFDRVLLEPNGSNRYGAAHAVEIEYAFNTLDSKKAPWQPEDRQTAQTMSAYWANFIKTGNPNGPGLPTWPEFGKTRQVMHLDAVSKAQPEQHRDRYELMDSMTK